MQLPHLQKPPVFRVIAVQGIVTILLSAVLMMHGATTAYSALLGGLICLIPNAYLVFRAFSVSGARAAKSIVREFYRGEAGKFVLTCCGFALVFALVRPLNVAVLFSAFMLVQAVHWFSPLLLKIRVS